MKGTGINKTTAIKKTYRKDFSRVIGI